MSCRFSRIDTSIWASAWASRRFASLGGNPRSRNTLPPDLVRWRDFVSMLISMSSFLNHGAIACPSDFDIAPVRFPSFLLETAEHIDGLLKLGDVHHAKPAIGAIDADLVGAWSNLRKRSPVIGDFAPLQLSQFVARQLP